MGDTIWASRTVEVAIGPGRPLCIIGERINPAGRPKLFNSLRQMDFSVAEADARAQLAAGAHGLDINAAVGGDMEGAALAGCAAHLDKVLDCPLAIDSADPQALARALCGLSGRPLVNSVNATQASMELLLPLAARHNLPIVASCLDETGLPATEQDCIEIARRIIARANDHGIARTDILVDPLVLPLGLDAGGKPVLAFPHPALKRGAHGMKRIFALLHRLREELDVNTLIAVSDISFGGPERERRNAEFIAGAMACGLNASILNPLQPMVMQAIRKTG